MRKSFFISGVIILLIYVISSNSSGANWTPMENGLTNTNVLALVINPLTPDTLYAGTGGGGVFVSIDGGANWTAMNNGLANTQNNGNIQVNALFINPQTLHTLYANVGAGVFKTIDGGAHWTAMNGPSTIGFYLLAINPQAPDTLYAGTGYGVFKSINGGANWTATGLTNPNIFDFAINPQTPDILYASTSDKGVFKSIDGGANWTVIGFTDTIVNVLVIDPQTPDTLYAGTFGYGLFKSTNGGANWTAIDNGLTNTLGVNIGDIGFSALVIIPQTPDVLYAGTGYGVFKSIDGGANWIIMNTGLNSHQILALALNPQPPITLFAGANFGGVWKFVDLSNISIDPSSINFGNVTVGQSSTRTSRSRTKPVRQET